MIPDSIHEQLGAAGFAPLSVEPTSTRGNRSDTFRIAHSAGSAILKIYNHRGATPSEKWLRERLALRMLAGIRGIPRALVDEQPDWLLMECCPGNTLHEMWEQLDQTQRRRLCEDIGSCYAGLVAASQDVTVHDRVRGSRSRSFADCVPTTIRAIESLRAEEPLVRRPVYLAAFDWIARHRGPLADAPPMLTKADFNPHNIIVQDGRASGIIDWEEACVGNRWVHLGIVLDHTHWLEWPAMRAGLESATGAWSREEEEIVFAGAMLCMWRKILNMFPGPTAWFGDGTRIEDRMRTIAVAMGRGGVLDGE